MRSWHLVPSAGLPVATAGKGATSAIDWSAVGARVVPYPRGFGPTRFRSSETPRSGQQAALGRDVISLLDALEPGAMIAGFDWGELSACVAAALWPDRVAGLVSLAGCDVIDVERLRHPLAPALEQVLWYQHLFHRTRPPVPAR